MNNLPFYYLNDHVLALGAKRHSLLSLYKGYGDFFKFPEINAITIKMLSFDPLTKKTTVK